MDLFALLFSEETKQTKRPNYERLAHRIRESILNGRLKAGEKLPSTRRVSQQLKVARNTVITAYEQLISEGLLESYKGAGTFVTDLKLEAPIKGTIDTQACEEQGQSLSDLGIRLSTQQSYSQPKGVFQIAQPALELFPKKAWFSAVQRALKQETFETYASLQGPLILREQLSELLYRSRSVKADPDQIVITSGSQQGLSMALAILLADGQTLYLEDYGYQGVDQLLEAKGVIPDIIPSDQNGMQTKLLKNKPGGVLIVTPSRSYPMGHTLPLDRRLEVLHWAIQSQSWVIEDDYDSEFMANGRPIGALQGMDTHNRVIYTGTFSRTLFPGLRIGYLVLPKSLVPLFIRYRRVLDGGVNSIMSTALGLFIQEGEYGKHLRRMHKCYKNRQKILNQSLHEWIPDWQPVNDQGGMHNLYKLPDNIEDRRLVSFLNSNGIALRALSEYSRVDEYPTDGVLIGFGNVQEHHIKSTIKTINNLYYSYKSKGYDSFQ